jgi:transglutaminase-like putative cysteine protease
MKLHVIHRTRYEYPVPVIESFNETRLQPTSTDGQVCHSFLLKVLPSTRLAHYLDFYLNCVHFFEIPEPHTSLSIESTSVVTTVSHLLPPDQVTVPMDRLKECLAM